MLVFLGRIMNQLVQGYLKKVPLQKGAHGTSFYDVSMRCWPIDMDAFMHMNNACYVRCAELARWRVFLQSNTLKMTSLQGILFLAVEQHVSYLKPISPFAKYTIRTSITSSDNKWLHYRHTFQQHASQVKEGKDPVVYAVVDCKAVLKEKSGKTVKIDQLVQHNEFYRDAVTPRTHHHN